MNLEGGEFYHLGNTSELVDTNLAVQNRIHDQREIWHKNIKPHPSIFVLNSNINIKWNISHRNIWIENSYVPDSWSLQENHAITGIPENNWKLQLNQGDCLDIVPLNDDSVAIRNYGFNDRFKGYLTETSTVFMGEPLYEWLAKRNLSGCFNGLPEDTDIHSLPLFPVMASGKLDERFNSSGCLIRSLWIIVNMTVCGLSSERISAMRLATGVIFQRWSAGENC